jgi:PAT family beta-lactamase induction signal transducer AmpG
MASIAGLGQSDPANNPWMVAFAAFLVTFFSASQDIVVDAYRREDLSDEELGLGSSLYINGYRIGMLLASGGGLIMADYIAFSMVYLILAICMLPGIVTTLLTPEPENFAGKPQNMKEAVVDPLVEYFNRSGALWILAFILLYKVGDTMASAMTTPFYLDIGFSKSEIGAIVKLFGFWATMIGLPAAVIAFENLSSGMGTAAYAAFMASITNKKFTATQYALLTSLMGVPRVLASAPTGFLAKNAGWEFFFIACALVAIPGMLLLLKFAPWNSKTGVEVEPI